jgi:hypothetical protein
MINSFKQAEPTAHAVGVTQAVEEPRQNVVERVAEPEVQNQWMKLVMGEPKTHDMKRSCTMGAGAAMAATPANGEWTLQPENVKHPLLGQVLPDTPRSRWLVDSGCNHHMHSVRRTGGRFLGQ